MKLYYYEHCPFSARVRMALHLKQVAAERVVLLADDEETTARLAGRHQIPVFVRDDGEAMIESLDIVRYIDRLDGAPTFDPWSSPEARAWLEGFVPTLQFLGYPRWTRIGLAEFATPAAYEHFREKKTQSIGEFGDAVRQTAARAQQASRDLETLTGVVDLDAGREQAGMDDFAILPMLRALSVVKAVTWPQALREYTVTLCERAGLDTFFDRAL